MTHGLRKKRLKRNRHMTEKEIIRLLEKGETHKVEYKSSLSDTDRIIEVVCSFANTEGGVVLIGIKEEK